MFGIANRAIIDYREDDQTWIVTLPSLQSEHTAARCVECNSYDSAIGLIEGWFECWNSQRHGVPQVEFRRSRSTVIIPLAEVSDETR